MLHYSDYSDVVEIYNLPAGYKITDDLSNVIGYPIVYDNKNIN